MTSPATILIQTVPGITTQAIDDVARELATIGRTVRTTGPYDILLEVNATDPDALARITLSVQALPPVSRTLTLPHVPGA